MMKMRTFLCWTALAAVTTVANALPVDDNNNLSLQESCDLVCNSAATSLCWRYASNYVYGASVSRLCCLTTQVPEIHSLNMDYTPFVNESVFHEILNWSEKPLPRESTTLFLKCIRDCSLEGRQVTLKTCQDYMKNPSICPRNRC